MKILELLTKRRIIGNVGEDAAAKFLKRKGYKILSRNFVGDNHEIDIIAKKDGVIAFIEVKTRTLGHENPREARPASSVTQEKQQSIIAAAKIFLSHSRHEGRKRFDIIEVYLENDSKKSKVSSISHLENTFNLNTAYRHHR